MSHGEVVNYPGDIGLLLLLGTIPGSSRPSSGTGTTWTRPARRWRSGGWGDRDIFLCSPLYIDIIRVDRKCQLGHSPALC